MGFRDRKAWGCSRSPSRGVGEDQIPLNVDLVALTTTINSKKKNGHHAVNININTQEAGYDKGTHGPWRVEFVGGRWDLEPMSRFRDTMSTIETAGWRIPEICHSLYRGKRWFGPWGFETSYIPGGQRETISAGSFMRPAMLKGSKTGRQKHGERDGLNSILVCHPE